jgi:hypothetical protein
LTAADVRDDGKSGLEDVAEKGAPFAFEGFAEANQMEMNRVLAVGFCIKPRIEVLVLWCLDSTPKSWL